jgi:GNAT superfamily N-acetyltransferase
VTDEPDLTELIRRVERGEFPEPDGAVRVIPPPDGAAAVLAFTSHVVVAADVDPGWVTEQIPTGDLSEATNPPFLAALCDQLDRRVNSIDLVALASGLDGPPPLPLTELTDASHARVRRARRYRSAVRVWATDGGVVVMGRGLAGRLEVAFEVDPDRRGHGLGGELARSARHLVRRLRPDGAGLWAQVAPGNAASVRTLIGAGYEPVGGEALLVDHQGESAS